MNEIGVPCIVGESWDEEDFLVTVTAITFSENDEQCLYEITLIAENQELLSDKNGDMELYCNILDTNDAFVLSS